MVLHSFRFVHNFMFIDFLWFIRWAFMIHITFVKFVTFSKFGWKMKLLYKENHNFARREFKFFFDFSKKEFFFFQSRHQDCKISMYISIICQIHENVGLKSQSKVIEKMLLKIVFSSWPHALSRCFRPFLKFSWFVGITHTFALH